MVFSGCPSVGLAAQEEGDDLPSSLWAEAVLDVPGSPVNLTWKLVGADITPSGDQVISGYFYASPDAFAYGSVYNPEVFVKIYIASNGWANIAFNHVTVDPVTVFSAHHYAGTAQQTGTATLANRLVEHQYNGVAIDYTLQSSGGAFAASSDSGYPIISSLWAKAILQPATGPVNLIWKEVGTDTTPSGDNVVSGYFYAHPSDFAYGSEYNPEVFVKIYIASNGWANIAFNHVTVDTVSIASAHHFSGQADKSGTAALNARLVEHQYDGVDGSGQNDGDNSTGNQEFDLNSAVASDPLSGFRNDTPTNTLIPTSVDYSSRMPSVKSQGSTSSCTSWATGYYYKTYHEAVEEGWDQDQHSYSPMYLYSLQCKNYSQPWSFIAAWETLNRNGCPKYATMPFIDLSGSNEKSDYANVTISNTAATEAKKYRCGERNEMKGLSQVKQALTQSPVLLGINHYSNLHMSSNWNPSPENNYITYDAFNSNVGHAVLCVGYDDSKFGTGALRFINSWGQDWAIDGFSWLRYSDYDDIVLFAMSIQDIPNANPPEDSTSRPSAPSNVAATDAAGPYVDITWSQVNSAQYYRVFRKKVSDFSTYQEIATVYQTSYRDYPAPGLPYYYSVVSYNDVGNSAHYASDTDSKAYVDRGSVKGSSLDKPTLGWVANDDTSVQSQFVVSNLATDATAMEILVATNSAGPWHSFGWANPGNFSITWGQDSEYIGKKPFVKIVASNSSGSSESSNSVQVGQTIVSPVNVAAITSLQVSELNSRLRLTWTTNGGGADSFEIWRWLAAEDEGNEWIFIGIVNGDVLTYDDTAALPGKSYYYAVAAVYQGTFGEFIITDTTASLVTTQANLFLYEVVYDIGQISNPVDFELSVWNDGGTAIDDYTIKIYVYDWDEGTYYFPFETLQASTYATAPLQPGYSQTLSVSLDLPLGYADGHSYSWIIELDYEDELSELYEDDNWIITTDEWWSNDLSASHSNLFLSQITYNYGQITNPVFFDLTVKNDGDTIIGNYSIAIKAYDWTDDTVYLPFDTFYASSVASTGQLPLSAGVEHTLSFSMNVPSAYADGHNYSWVVLLDPTDEISEKFEDDNLIESWETWWATPGTLGLGIAATGSSEKRIEYKKLMAPAKQSIKTLPSVVHTDVARAGERLVETYSRASATRTGTASSRPFSKKRMGQGALKSGNMKPLTVDDRQKNTRPIQFKKPSFCVNHEQ